MPLFSETTLAFTTLLVGLLTTGVLLLLPSTWQGDGRALRYWVIGNLSIGLFRLYKLVNALSPQQPMPPGLDALMAAFIVLGAGMHASALRLLLAPDRRDLGWSWPAGLALAVALLGAALSDPSLVLLTVLAGAILCMLAQVTVCWPRRRELRGARVQLVAVFFCLLMNAAGVWDVAQRLHRDGLTGVVVPTPTAVLALDLVVSLVVNLAFLMMLIELLQQRVERLSVTDALTGVFNRRGLLQAANLQTLHATRAGARARATSLLMLDLDHFKQINDTLGHPVGDAVLQGMAERVATLVRQSDVIARWGGEEFVVLLPGLPLDKAHEVAERIRQGVARAPLAEGAPVITVSIGGAALDELLAVDQLPALIAEADRRLYLAKRRRNCVVTDAPAAIVEGAPGLQPALTPPGEAMPRGVSGRPSFG